LLRCRFRHGTDGELGDGSSEVDRRALQLERDWRVGDSHRPRADYYYGAES